MKEDKYHRDIFYEVSKLSLEEKTDILQKAKDISFEWKVDILDCNKSWQRQRIYMSFEDIMEKFDNKSHFVVIHRRGYDNWKDNIYFKHKWCLEIGFCTMTSPEYFLWIYVKEGRLQEFINEFRLKEKEI